jgi:hypothetical protein
MIIKTDDGRRIKCRTNAIQKGRGSTFEVWGKLWNARDNRWSTRDNLRYVTAYEIEPLSAAEEISASAGMAGIE